jgi:hypothetical protein
MLRTLKIILAAVALLAIGQVEGHAQATRTWVSGVGDDANPCSRTAPCKTFSGAISKTASNGEISVLDPGGYGGVMITKSINIVAEGTEGSILACGTNGIVVNAGVNDVVGIHGLLIEGCSNGLNGIRVIQAGSVHIRKCLIRGFQAQNAKAIDVSPSTAVNVKVHVSDCTVTKNSIGIQAAPTNTATVNMFLDRMTVQDNSNVGVRAAGAGATVLLNNSVVTGNTNGVGHPNGSTVISFGNNVIANNINDGEATTALQLQ